MTDPRLLLIRRWADELHACLLGDVWRDGRPAYLRLYALWKEMVAEGSGLPDTASASSKDGEQ